MIAPSWCICNDLNCCLKCGEEWDGTTTFPAKGIVGFHGTVQAVILRDQCCQNCGVTSSFDGTEYGLTVLGTSAEGLRYLISTLDFIQWISRILSSRDSLNNKLDWIAEYTSPHELVRLLWPSKPVMVRMFWSAVRTTVNTDHIGSNDYLKQTGCSFEIIVGDGTNCGCLIPTDRQYTCTPCNQKKGTP
jgi:hypothetical protein